MKARRRRLALAAWVGLAGLGDQAASAPILGLAYQPYVGQWSQSPDNPHAPGRFHVPAFNTYVGGIDLEHPARSLLVARQTIRLGFDRGGRLETVEASGALSFQPDALRDAGPEPWSHAHFRFFEGRTALPASLIHHAASVYRQLDHLREAAGGAPLTLTTYGTGFQAGYWRSVDGHPYATLPVWTDAQVVYAHGDGSTPTRTQAIEEVYFYFPPTAAYVRPAPDQIQVETTGRPGRDLKLVAVHQTLFEPARKTDPEARLNPGFFAGDANAQIALAAAEINAHAGQPLLTIKLGVDNLVVDGTLINDRMRFSILSALAQAQVANGRFPGTVTHLVLSNEYAQPPTTPDAANTSTEQITAMIRYAKARMRPDGEFAGLNLLVGARGHRFRAVDATSTDPGIRRFSQDVAALVAEADFLMENIYPSPEAVESARQRGDWNVFLKPETGELDIQWRRFRQVIGGLAGNKRIELMIGEIGHPTNGIAFNLPGYVEGDAQPSPNSAFAEVADALEANGPGIAQGGIDVFQRYFNERLASAFVRDAVAWSVRTGVQIHLFEAFDEPWKFRPDIPPGQTPGRSRLHRSGPYGAEGFYGLFGYTGVSNFRHDQGSPDRLRPGSKLTNPLPPGWNWAGPFDGRFHAKSSRLDFAGLARSFEPLTPP
ncbi:hypothetical protein [Thiocystis violacea]|uniref:hypothetical protein n=1 Tax=Thiocystis violacea TaxID=13725 RepID=UPI00190618D6|nr:hypothetical protein [Thiocystis violacea]MBK1718470.1 hypothetical protein [Thiocystis violacea]